MRRRSFIQYGILLLAIGMVLLTLLSMESSGKTIIVAQDGSGDNETIQDAIDNATAGDTIRVYEGRYVENVYVNITLSLIGNGSDDTIIDANGTGSAVIVNAPTVNISGFQCTGGGAAYDNAGVKVVSDHCRIFENDCSNNNRTGIYAYRTNGTIITGNTISSTSFAGIWLETCTNAEISWNDCIDSPDAYGISIMSSNGNSITNNTCKTGNSVGVTVSTSVWTTIADNDLSHSGAGISIETCDNTTITNNICTDTTSNGIRVLWSFYGTISDNTCTHNQKDGIFLREASHFTIANNICEQGSANGITFKDSSNHNSVAGNIFSNNTGKGVEIHNSNHISFTDTIVIGNDYGFEVIESQGVTAHDCDIYDNTAYGISVRDGNEYSVNATDNWWGFDSGPYHEQNNTEGEGNDVSDLVIFDPWVIKNITVNHKPQITGMYPHVGSTHKGSASRIEIWARDLDGNETIEFVQIAITNDTWNSGWQDMEYNDVPDTPRWQYEWDTTKVSDGEYVVRARAYDGIDYSEIADYDSVTVDNSPSGGGGGGCNTCCSSIIAAVIGMLAIIRKYW